MGIGSSQSEPNPRRPRASGLEMYLTCKLQSVCFSGTCLHDLEVEAMQGSGSQTIGLKGLKIVKLHGWQVLFQQVPLMSPPYHFIIFLFLLLPSSSSSFFLLLLSPSFFLLLPFPFSSSSSFLLDTDLIS